MLLVQSCNTSTQNKTYKRGRVWIYEVTDVDKKGELSNSIIIKLTVIDEWWHENIIGGSLIDYEYIKDGKIVKTTTTVASDNKNSISTSIHPPRSMFLSFTEIAPFPISCNPGYMKYESKNEIHVEQYPDYKDGILEGKVIKQNVNTIDTTSYSFNGKQYKVWVNEGYNTNYIDELGQFKCISLFNEEIGFVNIQYLKPDSSVV